MFNGWFFWMCGTDLQVSKCGAFRPLIIFQGYLSAICLIMLCWHSEKDSETCFTVGTMLSIQPKCV